MTPRELITLADLRRQRKAPQLAVFVTDHWPWAQRLTDDIGALCIRVRDGDDHAHDWSSVAGLWVVLSLRRGSDAQYADFGMKLLQAYPWRLSVYRDGHMRKVWQQEQAA